MNVDRRVCPKTLSCINAPEIPISIPRLAYKMNVLFKAEQCTQMALSAIFHFYHRYYPFINRRPTTSIKYFAVEVSPLASPCYPVAMKLLHFFQVRRLLTSYTQAKALFTKVFAYIELVI